MQNYPVCKEKTGFQHRKIRMDAVAREQMEKFDAYCLTMKKKVEQQREERKRYNEELQERLRVQQEIVSYIRNFSIATIENLIMAQIVTTTTVSNKAHDDSYLYGETMIHRYQWYYQWLQW